MNQLNISSTPRTRFNRCIHTASYMVWTCSFLAIVTFGFMQGPLLAQDDDIDLQADPLGQGPGQDNAVARDNRCRQWIRGIIQNELYVLETVCSLTPEQSQKLVDLIEKDWKSKTTTIVKANAASTYTNQIDLENKMERLFSLWVSDLLPESEINKFQSELAARLALRRRLVIGKMILETEKKLGLTATQMQELKPLLEERWKDSWWGMYRSGTLPETKQLWMMTVLSEEQKTIGNDRTASALTETMVRATRVVDYPSKPLKDRFEIGNIKSSETIPLSSTTTAKSSKNDKDPKAQAPVDGVKNDQLR